MSRVLKLFPSNSLKTRVTIFTIIVFAVSIWSLALYVSRMLREDMQRLLGDQLFSNVVLLANDINDQVKDRIGALEIIANSINAANIGNPASLQRQLEQNRTIQLLFNAGIFVTDAKGSAIASLPLSAERVGVNYMDRDHVATALREGKTSFSKPLISQKLHVPVISLATPILDEQGKVIGSLVGVTDLSRPNFLDQVAQNHYGVSGGYIVISPLYRLVITATDKTRVMTALPAPGANLLLDRYLQGYEGAGRVVDTRGQDVLSAAKQIPAANWLLIARIPGAEVFAPIQDMQKRTLLAAILLTLLVGGASWWMLRWQLAPMTAAVRSLPALLDANVSQHPLPIVRQDEIGELIGGFNHLLEHLGKREEVLKASERLLKESQNIAGLGDYTLNIATGLWTSSEVLDGLLGIDASYVRSVEGWTALIHPDDQLMMATYFRDHVVGRKQLFDKKYRILRPTDGVVRWVHGLGKIEFDAVGNPLEMHGTIQDITERHANQIQIESLAYSDPLTRLPNRRFLMDRIAKAMSNSVRRHTQCALLMVDLDNFKTLNDTLGHHQGDIVLEEVAKRLIACVREGDTVARLGGDEFVVLLEDLTESTEDAAAQVQQVGDKILLAVDQPYQLEITTHRSTASIGITLFGIAAENIDDPLKRADMAMYQSKLAGHNTLRFFDPQMQIAVNARAAMEAGLHQAWQENQFILHYQPQVDREGRITGVEALLRWLHPQLGMISPAEFIPLAEETGLILKIGHWVLETACEQLALWAFSPDRSQLTISVNVSAREFAQGNFVEQVLGTLARTNAKAAQLKLELTEGVLVADVEDVIAKMNALKAVGVGFSLDDFGTGYSSLSYLKRLPLDQLKIDQGFVRDILSDANDAAIARMVIALAGTLGLGVIAEGVETQDQRDFLASIGCNDYQGYLFSRPIHIEELEALYCFARSYGSV